MENLEFGKVLESSDLAEIVKNMKAEGKKVVHTSGVFDVLHPGHLTYLKEARELGDVLIVSLNSDASTRGIKGPSRPYNSQAERALMLAGLRWVDYVTHFDEETPEAILEKLQPSVHIKGGDYDPDAMPETSVVRKHGGEVKVIPLVGEYSTTRFIGRVLEADKLDDKFERPDHVTTRK